MSKTLERLKTDHRRIRNVLNALQVKAAELDTATLTKDTDHLFCMIDYLTEYPDKVHHPLEDSVLERLERDVLNDDQRQLIDTLEKQHIQLVKFTSDLLAAMDSLDGAEEISAFVSDVENYVSLQREHMAFEEEHVFPLAADMLSDEIWSELDHAWGDPTDPLFDRLERRYGAIYKFLEVDPLETAREGLAQPLYKYLGATGTPWAGI